MIKNANLLKGHIKWLENNKAIVVAILFVMLCLGLIEIVKAVINKTSLSIIRFERTVWLDVFFIIITTIFVIRTAYIWFYKQKRVSPQIAGLLLVSCSLYAYFRLFDRTFYSFICYWNGPVAYLDGFALIGFSILILWLKQQFSNKHNLRDNQLYSFNIDTPIEKADSDLFNLGSLVNRIVSFIACTDVSQGAFSIGIVGEWGDGKSSLMNLIEERIQTEHQDFVVVHFFPRASKKAEFIQEDFLDALKQSLKPFHSGVDKIIDKYAVSLDVIPGMPPFVLKLLSVFQIHIDKNSKSTRCRLKQAIKEIDRRIVVLIDDLDRLTGEELIEVMKVLDKNGAFPNMVFLTSFDKLYVNTILENYLKIGHQNRPYTDKYFTVEIKVPLHPSFRLMDYLIKTLRKACESHFINNLEADDVDKKTRQMESFLMPRLLTIRDVKRFANQFLYDYAEVQRDVNYQDFLLLELIKFRYLEEYQAIHRFQYIHRGSSSLLTTASADLIYLNKNLLLQKSQKGIDSLELNSLPESLDILRYLFPREDDYQSYFAGRYQRIGSISSFEHYFYNYEYSHLTTEDIESLSIYNSLFNACKIIDSWRPFSKDLETYLLTRDVLKVSDKESLCKYLQFLLYTGYCYPSMNYYTQGYLFLREEYVNHIIESCNFVDVGEYKSWLKRGLDELYTVNPIIPFLFITRSLSERFENKLDLDPNIGPTTYVYMVNELQDYALELLMRYLEQIDQINWQASIAFQMSKIQSNDSNVPLQVAVEMLHDSMVKHFDRYSSSIPVVFKNNEIINAGFNRDFLFGETFKEKDEFERIINDEKFKDAQGIELTKAIWLVYKANGYQDFALPRGTHLGDAKSVLLNGALKELKRCKGIEKEIDMIVNDWLKVCKLKYVDLFILRARELQKKIYNTKWSLKLHDIYSIRLDDIVNQLYEYANTARNLDEEMLRVGDFVRIKESAYHRILNEHLDNIIYNENIFTIKSIKEGVGIITKENNWILSFDDIEAILIDGKEDASIYYDPILMASYVAYDQKAPAYRTNYSYYMKHFKSCYDNRNISFYEIVKKQGFQFVYEVQHWLEDEMHSGKLMLNHAFR